MLRSWEESPSTSELVRRCTELAVGGGSREQVCDLSSDTDDVSVSVTIGPAPESGQRRVESLHVKTAPANSLKTVLPQSPLIPIGLSHRSLVVPSSGTLAVTSTHSRSSSFSGRSITGRRFATTRADREGRKDQFRVRNGRRRS